MWRHAVLLGLVGCYSPSVTPGAPCSPDGFCPTGLTCYGGRCLTGPPVLDAERDSLVLDDGSVDGRQIDAPMIDGPTVDAPLDAFVLGPWPAGVPTAGVDQSGAEEDPSFTTDRLTLVFARNGDLFIATRTTVSMAYTVTPLTVLDSAANEASPEIDALGTTIYFTSDRVLLGDMDVYVSTRTGAGWSAPALVTELSPNDIGDVAISPDGLTAIVAHGSFSRSTRATIASTWGTPVAITGVNFGINPAAPSLSALGDLYFHAGTTRDLYVARKNGASFDPPVAITELNTTLRDASPFISADGRYIMWEYNGDLYESAR